MLDVTGAEIRAPKKPSEVFLELWQWRALDQSPEKFAECAAAWRQIVSLEEIYAEAHGRARLDAILEHVMKDPSPAGGPVRDDREKPAPVPMPMMEVPAPREITYDCASAPMTEEAEAAEAKAREAANRSAGAKAGFATRKRNLTERLEELRRRGVKLHEIAAAENGLTINDVMDALAAKPMSPMKIQALEKACRKLEEAEGSGGE